jgi:hypothetical protein
MRNRLAHLPLVGLAVLSSCDVLPPLACTTEARAAINVEVRDSVTDAPAAAGALAIARDGVFADTLIGFDGLSVGGAWERPGNYAVSVTKAGYQGWSVSDVRVTDGSCHVRSVTLQARLQPA